jgi:hypothetical protein
MFVKPPLELPKVLHHWYRSVSAFPDGALAHDGDCQLYDYSVHICSCGLLHALRRIDEAVKHYPAVDMEIVLHDKACASIQKKGKKAAERGG